jgi:2-polyprenyl-6-methoxyphenol hydroxylase-like FAD-dependent oxidoreductase
VTAVSATEDFDVLIAGGGPVGLAAAVELGHRGVRCLVVERNAGVGNSPRAKTTNVRTREHLRRWGLADTLRAASPIPPDYPPDVVFATRMDGSLLARFHDCFNGTRVRNNLYSEEAQWVPQSVLEEVLRAHAVSLPGVSVLFDTELDAFEHAATGVSATLRNRATGATRAVRAAYLIGADGARSTVRKQLGIPLLGQESAFRNTNVVFRAPDLAARHGFGRAIMYWMVNQDVPALLGPMDVAGLWYFIATKVPEGAPEDVAALIRLSTGLPGLDIEIVTSEQWIARTLVAEHYGRGRVFLAGDSCHLHPPFGGFGMNMGIGDAVDLGWKIAATLQGWGGADLLASYETERRPVHLRTIAESVANYAAVANQLVQPGLEDAGPMGDATRREVSDVILATKAREFKTLGVVLGMRYADSPIIVADGSPPPPEHPMIYAPSAHPGCLAPHLWLADGSSLYDHFGPGFTLLATAGDATQAAAMVRAAESAGLPLAVLTPGDTRLPARYGARFALIRPDQHVAWRGDALPPDCTGLIACVTGHAPIAIAAV